MPAPLDAALPNDTDIVVTRSFNAPARYLWDCHTIPALVQRWMLGPPGWTMPVCDIDLLVGGAYLYTWRNTESGAEFSMTGVFHEIEAPRRIVYAERFKDGESRVTLTLQESQGVTTLTTTISFPSRAARDAAFATGMTRGMEQSYARLDAFAASAT